MAEPSTPSTAFATPEESPPIPSYSPFRHTVFAPSPPASSDEDDDDIGNQTAMQIDPEPIQPRTRPRYNVESRASLSSEAQRERYSTISTYTTRTGISEMPSLPSIGGYDDYLEEIDNSRVTVGLRESEEVADILSRQVFSLKLDLVCRDQKIQELQGRIAQLEGCEQDASSSSSTERTRHKLTKLDLEMEEEHGPECRKAMKVVLKQIEKRDGMLKEIGGLIVRMKDKLDNAEMQAPAARHLEASIPRFQPQQHQQQRLLQEPHRTPLRPSPADPKTPLRPSLADPRDSHHYTPASLWTPDSIRDTTPRRRHVPISTRRTSLNPQTTPHLRIPPLSLTKSTTLLPHSRPSPLLRHSISNNLPTVTKLHNNLNTVLEHPAYRPENPTPSERGRREQEARAVLGSPFEPRPRKSKRDSVGSATTDVWLSIPDLTLNTPKTLKSPVLKSAWSSSTQVDYSPGTLDGFAESPLRKEVHDGGSQRNSTQVDFSTRSIGYFAESGHDGTKRYSKQREELRDFSPISTLATENKDLPSQNTATILGSPMRGRTQRSTPARKEKVGGMDERRDWFEGGLLRYAGGEARKVQIRRSHFFIPHKDGVPRANSEERVRERREVKSLDTEPEKHKHKEAIAVSSRHTYETTEDKDETNAPSPPLQPKGSPLHFTHPNTSLASLTEPTNTAPQHPQPPRKLRIPNPRFSTILEASTESLLPPPPSRIPIPSPPPKHRTPLPPTRPSKFTENIPPSTPQTQKIKNLKTPESSARKRRVAKIQRRKGAGTGGRVVGRTVGVQVTVERKRRLPKVVQDQHEEEEEGKREEEGGGVRRLLRFDMWR